jgi:hypothetical protein
MQLACCVEDFRLREAPSEICEDRGQGKLVTARLRGWTESDSLARNQGNNPRTSVASATRPTAST